MRTYANLPWQRRRVDKILTLVPSSRPDHPPRRLKPDEVFDLVADYNEGTRINDLAAKYGINRVTVMAHLKREGAESRRGVVERRLPEATALYKGGWSLARIGEKLGVSPGTVWLTLQKHGVQMRDQQGRSR